MQVAERWVRQKKLYSLEGAIALRTRENSPEILAEKEKWKRKREEIKAKTPEDPRIAMEKKLGLPPESILLINGVLVFAETREPVVLQNAYAA